MLSVIYDESRGKILAKYVENFGRVCEIDVTDQALQAVFRYLMAHGLSLAEHCEYEVDGNKFRTSLVKEEPTIDPVKHGHWLKHEIVVNGKVTFAKDAFVCSLCQDIWHTSSKMKYCPSCGAKMDVVNNSPLFNLDKTMEFKVVGDIKPVIRQILGEYEEWESSDCAVHLKGAPGISLPGYYPRLTYYACFAKPKCRLIIAQLYEEGLIELHCVRN